MRAVTIVCMLLLLTEVAIAGPTLDERVEILWERAVRQTDFAKWDDAVATGSHAVAIAPRHADAWALLAWARWMHPDGLSYLARGQVQRALGLDPESARARMVSGLVTPFVTDPPDLDRSITELQRAVRLDPSLAQAWSRLGLARFDRGDPHAAVADIRRAVELQPLRYEWHLHLAEVLLALGEVDDAVASNRRALELTFSPFSEMLALNNLAWSLCLLLPEDDAQRTEALEISRRLAAETPSNPEILETIGTAELLFGEAGRAERALRNALAAGKDAHAALAYALAREGRHAEAREQLSRFSSLYLSGEAEAEHSYFAGLAWEALGEPRVARRIFERATERWPEHPWANAMRRRLEEH